MADYVWNIGALSGTWENPLSWAPAGGPPTLATLDTALLEDITTASFTDTVSAGKSDGADVLQFTGDLTTPTLAINGTLTVNTLLYEFDVASATVDINAGGTFKINDDIGDFLTPAETITVSGKGAAGGHLTLGNLTIGEGIPLTFTFDNNATGKNAGVIEFGTTGPTASQTITNVAWGDEFIIDGANFKGDTVTYTKATTTLTVKNGGGTTVFTMTGVNAAAGTPTFTIVDTDIIQAVCYARGTMLRTPDGELPVEKLRAGKQVITLVDGQEIAKTVVWPGHRRINVAGHPRPETVAPIRIIRDAFADGMPHRDLIVSPDHAIFVDGKLICARQLVNGTTIRQELDWTAIDYYHVELESHAILLAEGLPAESYIDTGNSGFFANSGAPLVLHPDLTDESDYPTREAGSCAPFVWDEANVRPVWQHLAERAAAIGQPMPTRETTMEAGLRLRANGRTLKPIYSDDRLAIFVLPRGAREARLLSLSQSPTEARPWLDDRRSLGVRVKRIVLRGVDEQREIPVDHPDLTRGWWAVERDGQSMSRWTDGEAVLPLPAMPGTAMLEIHLAGTMTYVVEGAPESGTERQAA
jgi:hypothetical protein